jgi:hypothetical protein
MIPTDHLILAFLWAQNGGTVNSGAVKDAIGDPMDFDAALGALTSGRITAAAGADGVSLDIALSPSENADTIMATARGVMSGAELLQYEEYFAAFGMTQVVTNPFRDETLAAGLGAGDARLASNAVRLLAWGHQKRTNDMALLVPSARAAAVADRAALALT